MIDEAIAALRAAVAALLALDLCAESSLSITTALVELETQKRRLAAVDVGLLTRVRDRRIAAERCRTSVADLLVGLLGVAPGEARARVLAAEDLGPRMTLSGEVLEPAPARVAAAIASGEISPGHVAVIGRSLDRLPAEIGYEAGPVAEQLLLEAAQHEHPRRLEQTAWLMHARLDPDGPEPHDASGRPEFTLTPHASGWATARGTPDPRPASQRRHDALYEMARRLLHSGGWGTHDDHRDHS